MTCPACAAAAERVSAMFYVNCQQCRCRAIARSPQFREARDAGRLTPAYRLMLEAIFSVGCDLAQAHERVKAAAANDFESRETC